MKLTTSGGPCRQCQHFEPRSTSEPMAAKGYCRNFERAVNPTSRNGCFVPRGDSHQAPAASSPPAASQFSGSPAVVPVANRPHTDVDERLRGVAGWLLLLCVWLTFLRPTLFLIGEYIEQLTVYGSFELRYVLSFPQFIDLPAGVRAVKAITATVNIGMLAFGCVAGLALWGKYKDALELTNTFLSIMVFSSLVLMMVPNAVGVPERLLPVYNRSLMLQFVQQAVAALAIFTYLSRSRRVAVTYDLATRASAAGLADTQPGTPVSTMSPDDHGPLAGGVYGEDLDVDRVSLGQLTDDGATHPGPAHSYTSDAVPSDSQKRRGDNERRQFSSSDSNARPVVVGRADHHVEISLGAAIGGALVAAYIADAMGLSAAGFVLAWLLCAVGMRVLGPMLLQYMRDL